ncbi:UNKNOWN [Stylonychia lemnae]|uniref:Uncharacterized protein n=1 Tax=Stylonychia lemnae TaxID=5949 RepID=A0A077ZUG9_STYLE|nr:UNKNOWN [Stylonychia lemnae]|eukprot:CDW72940.1 UNKNOWN [Stylonychia lemnae]
MIRSVNLDQMLNPLSQCKIQNPQLMKALKDLLIYNTIFENSRDIQETLNNLMDLDDHFGSEIWRSFVDNIIVNQISQWNCSQFIEIVSIYREMRRTYMLRDLIYQYKFLVVEDIDSRSIKELLLLIQIYKYDLQFKSFIGNQLKEKIIKNANLNMRDLMTTLNETLDLPDLRRDIIKYSLNSELFYAFPISYLITLLNSIQKLEQPYYHNHILYQLCLMEKQISLQSLDKLCRTHYKLPVLNSHFLAMLVRLHNQNNTYKKNELKIFNLNISLLRLPTLNNLQLIDEYELALVNELNINKPEQFNVGTIIKFLTENQMFAKYGFYLGFNDLLFQSIISDEKANIDVWHISVLLKILNLGCTDKQFLQKVEKLIEKNFERFCQNTLVKFTTLVLEICPDNARYKELLHKRVKNMRPESINDPKVSIGFLYQVAKLDTGQDQIFEKFFNYNLKYVNSLYPYDITKMFQSIYIMKQTESSNNTKFYEKIFDKIQSFEKVQTYELIINIENLTGYFIYLPKQLKDKQLVVYKKLFTKIQNYLLDPSKRVIMLYKKYQMIFQQLLDNFNNLSKDDELQVLKPIIQDCLQIVQYHIRLDNESKESTTDSEDEQSTQRNSRGGKRNRNII